VSLHGTVANGELRDALGLAVSEMPGVEGVKNALRCGRANGFEARAEGVVENELLIERTEV
jgi:hypothetical protein